MFSPDPIYLSKKTNADINIPKGYFILTSFFNAHPSAAKQQYDFGEQYRFQIPMPVSVWNNQQPGTSGLSVYLPTV